MSDNDFSEEYSTRNFTRVQFESLCSITNVESETFSGQIHDISLNGFFISTDMELNNKKPYKICTDFAQRKNGIKGLFGSLNNLFSDTSFRNEYVVKLAHTNNSGSGFSILKTKKSSFKALVETLKSCGISGTTINKECTLSDCYKDLVDK
jgi:hypothetical protein